MSKILSWFVNTKLWEKLARHIIAHFTFRVIGYPKFPLEKYFEINQIINSDVNALYAFVSADMDSLAWRLTNLLTKARWGHAGFIIPSGDRLTVWHMKGSGLKKWDILELLKECDNFAVIKLPLSVENLKEARNRLQMIIDLPLVEYDYQLEINKDISVLLGSHDFGGGKKPLKIYCSEFVWVVGAGLVSDPDFKTHWSFDQETFEPDDVYAGGEIVFLHDIHTK